MPDAIPPGNPDAIGSELEAYRDRLRRMVQLRIDPRLRTRIDPSDVVQEVFLEASVRFSEVRQDAPGGIFAWLRLLATQKLAQLWRHHLETQGRDVRREEAWPALGDVDTAALARDITAAGPMPDSEAGRAELIDRTVRVLEQLPPLDREILALRHFEQLSNTDAAHLLGIEPAAASQRYGRALGRLRDLLAGS
jgi:RNA polymerase sigma-70 factor (ECF subfamily)